jgi:hypothetical protein
MFSKEFMRYLINYEPAGYECEEKQVSTVKEIEFRQPKRGELAKVYVTINKK